MKVPAHVIARIERRSRGRLDRRQARAAAELVRSHSNTDFIAFRAPGDFAANWREIAAIRDGGRSLREWRDWQVSKFWHYGSTFGEWPGERTPP